MITTKRTALSEKTYETKVNTRIEANFETETPQFNIKPIEMTATEIKPATRIAPQKSKETVMPSIKKRAQAKDMEEIAQIRSEKTENEVAVKLDSKAKTIVAMYALVSIVLAAIVLTTGIALTNRNARVASLENEVRAAYNNVVAQQEQMAYFSDETIVESAANELGMVETIAAEEIELIPLGEEITYEARTNAFDEFCDFISSIFGG